MANDKFVANVMPRIPVRRFGEPSDFGGIAVYIMSKASSYHTADCFPGRPLQGADIVRAAAPQAGEVNSLRLRRLADLVLRSGQEIAGIVA
ncbi:hypothetical protein E4T56_gene19720, partial [Termitomyces sp. T112]